MNHIFEFLSFGEAACNYSDPIKRQERFIGWGVRPKVRQCLQAPVCHPSIRTHRGKPRNVLYSDVYFESLQSLYVLLFTDG